MLIFLQDPQYSNAGVSLSGPKVLQKPDGLNFLAFQKTSSEHYSPNYVKHTEVFTSYTVYFSLHGLSPSIFFPDLSHSHCIVFECILILPIHNFVNALIFQYITFQYCSRSFMIGS